jgi:glycosyltransferase involved in cell wall biosynthesis
LAPYISIVVPTYNRPQALARCLGSIASLDYSSDRFEVIVVDDGSSYPLQEIISEFSGSFQIHYLAQDNLGPATARNAGAHLAQGEFLAFVDDDCVLSPRWLSRMAEAAGGSTMYLFGGHTDNALAENIYASASQMLVDFLYDHFLSRESPLRFFTSNNLMVERDHFIRIGGFHPGFALAAAEDRELSYRWLAEGGDLKFVPEAVVCHYHQMTLWSYCRQHFNYGRGALGFYRLARLRNGNRITVQSFDFYYSLLTYPSVGRPSRTVRLRGLLLLSQLANAVGVLWEYCASATSGKT